MSRPALALFLLSVTLDVLLLWIRLVQQKIGLWPDVLSGEWRTPAPALSPIIHDFNGRLGIMFEAWMKVTK